MSLKLTFNLNFWLLIVVISTALNPAYATNSDTAKESRWAEQVIDGLLDGEEVWLPDGSGHEFLGVYTPADGNPGQAVILVHGIGVHPNWPDVIYPLRAGLLEHGTTTLSLQMPILANEAEQSEYGNLFPELPNRFAAAIDFLSAEGYNNVTIVAHSMGASMAMYYLSRHFPEAVDSAVIIGMDAETDFDDKMEMLAKSRVPILDLYGSQDLEPVLNSASQRNETGSGRSGYSYQQVQVEGANHFFQGHEEVLVQQVVDWLETQDR